MQFTFYLVFGWSAWVISIGWVLAFIAWLLVQWFGLFAFYSNVLFPGILIMIWLIPLTIALASNDEKEGDFPWNLESIYFLAVVVSAVKPTLLACGKGSYLAFKRFISSSDDEDSDTVTDWLLRAAEFFALSSLEVYDMVSDFLVWQAGNYLDELEGIYAGACIFGVIVTFVFIVMLFLKIFVFRKKKH